jgi:uncharacterized protein YbjT (DUF2867 family)
MRLLIVGASGGCGRWATRRAAAAGHDVTALVLDWQAVRPVTLVDARAPSASARVVPRFRIVSRISRADVAAWLLRVATDPRPIVDRIPMIGYR